MAGEPVRYEAKDGIATLTLDRPDVLNAMNNPMRAQLLEIFTRLRTDDTVKAVVVTGALRIALVEPHPRLRLECRHLI